MRALCTICQLLLLVAVVGITPVVAQEVGTLAVAPNSLAPANRSKLISRIDIIFEGGRWSDSVKLQRVRVGEVFTPALARQAMAELLDTGRYASVRASVLPAGDALILRLAVVPRRIIAAVKFIDGKLPEGPARRAAEVAVGDELTALKLPAIAERLVSYYRASGFPDAAVQPKVVDTDRALEVLLLLHVDAGDPRIVRERIFAVSSVSSPALASVLRSYEVRVGARLDEARLSDADRALQDSLRRGGWHAALVSHSLGGDRRDRLSVNVQAGAYTRIRFEGVRAFDAVELRRSLDLQESDDRSVTTLAGRLRKHYVARGFLDTSVTPRPRMSKDRSLLDLKFVVREGTRVTVMAREYPCLRGARSADEVGEEIDSFLTEALPGSGVLAAVDSTVLDSRLGPRGRTGSRPMPESLDPWATYVPEVYDRAIEHLKGLYRSEGYLSAEVGPVVPMRRRCSTQSPPGRCLPVGQRERPTVICPKDDLALPQEDPGAGTVVACRADRARGISCERSVVLHIPVKLGPRSTLWDVAFDGNERLPSATLLEAADVNLGQPVSQVALEQARHRVLEAYKEEGYAFAAVELSLDLSPDHSRARARFTVSEHEQVIVRDIVVHGAKLTLESLILGRVALKIGGIYRRSEVRATEERLATLGVFSNVTVALQDPEVPAKQKLVVITVRERPAQYLDIRPGISTGEGLRATFEYGHRNVARRAIQFVFRVQLGFLPGSFILDDNVRQRFDDLPLGRRLERRNTASVEFPEIGLGPLFRFGIEGVDVRDNSRDFGITKDAVILTLRFRPSLKFSTELGASFELNDAEIFGKDEAGALQAYLEQNNSASLRRLLDVPQGSTFVVAQRTGLSWDRRDNPFAATSGSFFSVGVEHVQAFPSEDTLTTQAADEITETVTQKEFTDSQFLHVTHRVAAYAKLTEGGLTLATSFRWGMNYQLRNDSLTYPDRFFFLGGVDSLRGFVESSMIPQDLAERILDPNDAFSEESVTIRGGDVFINPRVELRIPLAGIWQTALFVDSGNFWLDPARLDPTVLRYAVGSGLRAQTPIGPLALDYGINLDRRPWEDPWAIHFSIGLF
ncbi:MAG: BamA/TamA family outer membrane protein [Polyangiaceae bacterium]|nr:BamA/TamA family outer membrane protein [Polyangiaceae bacterium]